MLLTGLEVSQRAGQELGEAGGRARSESRAPRSSWSACCPSPPPTHRLREKRGYSSGFYPPPRAPLLSEGQLTFTEHLLSARALLRGLHLSAHSAVVMTLLPSLHRGGSSTGRSSTLPGVAQLESGQPVIQTQAGSPCPPSEPQTASQPAARRPPVGESQKPGQ